MIALILVLCITAVQVALAYSIYRRRYAPPWVVYLQATVIVLFAWMWLDHMWFLADLQVAIDGLLSR